jgi:hypothetical protein
MRRLRGFASWPPPERREDGCYSVLGAARHFGVGKDVVRGWIEKGAVRISRQPGRLSGALWLHIDEETEARLTGLAEAARKRSDRRRTARRSEPTTSK